MPPTCARRDPARGPGLWRDGRGCRQPGQLLCVDREACAGRQVHRCASTGWSRRLVGPSLHGHRLVHAASSGHLCDRATSLRCEMGPSRPAPAAVRAQAQSRARARDHARSENKQRNGAAAGAGPPGFEHCQGQPGAGELTSTTVAPRREPGPKPWSPATCGCGTGLRGCTGWRRPDRERAARGRRG